MASYSASSPVVALHGPSEALAAVDTRASEANPSAPAQGDADEPVNAGQKAAEPDIIPLDITGEDISPRNRFLEIAAVFEHDSIELDLLDRIWKLHNANQTRFENLNCLAASLRRQRARLLGKTPSPSYIGTNLKGAIDTLKTIVGLIEDLDRHRHGIIREWIFHLGAERCPMPTNKHGYSLRGADAYLAALVEEHVRNLDRFGNECGTQADMLHDLDEASLEGRVNGMFIGCNRSTWEEPFRGLMTLVERNNRHFRNALAEREAGFARGPVARREKAIMAQPAFAVAHHVEKATLQ